MQAKRFDFKQFSICNGECGMPVSTDGVILGAWAPLPQQGKILDIGCGTGLLSLMAAQRQPNIQIDAIDIAQSAIQTCQHNVGHSPWAQRIAIAHSAVQQWQQTHPQQYAAIICNPPYFSHGQTAQCQQRAAARHDAQLNQHELLTSLAELLCNTACASLILPTYEAQQMLAKLSHYRLHCTAQLAIRSSSKKPYQRLAFCLSRQAPSQQQQETLTIHAPSGGYDPKFIALTRDFYLKFDSAPNAERSSAGHS